MCAKTISLSDKGFPSELFQENGLFQLPLTNGPQRSLGCVAEFSVETLDILILTCRYKELFQIKSLTKSLIQSLDWTLIKLFHLKSTFS